MFNSFTTKFVFVAVLVAVLFSAVSFANVSADDGTVTRTPATHLFDTSTYRYFISDGSVFRCVHGTDAVMFAAAYSGNVCQYLRTDDSTLIEITVK